MRVERLVRRAHVLQHPVDDLVGRHGVGQRFVRQHQPVPQHVRREVGDVLRQHVRASAQERERAGALDQRDRRPGAGAERQVLAEVLDAVALGVARRVGELHRVLHQRGVDVALAALALQRVQLLGGGHRHDVARLAVTRSTMTNSSSSSDSRPGPSS
jgi:hypothetical protein